MSTPARALALDVLVEVSVADAYGNLIVEKSGERD